MITSESSLRDIAMAVGKGLKDHGIDAVLSGGAVVSLYSENKYQSYDLDFVVYETGKKLEDAMASIGFVKSKGRYFTHPATEYIVEFPAAPVAIGNQPVTKFNEIESDAGYLKLLTPTQSVMDRLAAFYFWNDQQCLEQAILIAKEQDINLKEIKKWSADEDMHDKFERFASMLAQ